MNKLKCVVVDDDPFLIQVMKDLCQDSPIAFITRTFTNPKDFLEAMPELDFDLCLLDILMPEMEGLVLAQLLGDKPIIFITGVDHKLKDALDLAPIDIITKPIKKDRLDKALTKAFSLIQEKKEFALFSVDGKGKMKLRVCDMFLMQVSNTDARNKKVTMRDGTIYMLMDYRFEDLLDASSRFVQINKSTAISLEAVEEVNGFTIILKRFPGKNKRKEVTLSSSYKRKFMEMLPMIRNGANE